MKKAETGGDRVPAPRACCTSGRAVSARRAAILFDCGKSHNHSCRSVNGRLSVNHRHDGMVRQKRPRGCQHSPDHGDTRHRADAEGVHDATGGVSAQGWPTRGGWGSASCGEGRAHELHSREPVDTELWADVGRPRAVHENCREVIWDVRRKRRRGRKGGGRGEGWMESNQTGREGTAAANSIGSAVCAQSIPQSNGGGETHQCFIHCVFSCTGPRTQRRGEGGGRGEGRGVAVFHRTRAPPDRIARQQCARTSVGAPRMSGSPPTHRRAANSKYMSRERKTPSTCVSNIHSPRPHHGDRGIGVPADLDEDEKARPRARGDEHVPALAGLELEEALLVARVQVRWWVDGGREGGGGENVGQPKCDVMEQRSAQGAQQGR